MAVLYGDSYEKYEETFPVFLRCHLQEPSTGEILQAHPPTERTKTYPNGVRALKSVSLEIPRGMFGLLGPNGAGTLIGSVMPWIDPERLGPFTLAPYVFSLGAVAFPNLFFSACVFFTLAILSRSMIYTYVGLVGFFVLAYLIADLFENITLFENRVEEARFAERADGRYAVTIVAPARKLRADGQGVETEIAIDDWIEIGVRPLQPLCSAAFLPKS